MLYQLIVPFAHLLAAPWGYSALVNGFTLIGDNQVLVNANYLTVALATLTGPVRIIKTEEVWRRFFKADIIQFKPVAKKAFCLNCFICRILSRTNIAIAFTLKKSGLYRVA